MSFISNNQYFLQHLRKELAKVSEQEAVELFNTKYKEQAFTRIIDGYRKIHSSAERIIYYSEVIEQLGPYVINELIVDIYLEEDCNQILQKVSGKLNTLGADLSKDIFLPTLLSLSCNSFLNDELRKNIGASEQDLHNTNQNLHPIIRKFTDRINALLIKPTGEPELRILLIHFMKFWCSLPERINRNDKAILLLHHLNSFLVTEQINICQHLRRIVADLNDYRLKDPIAIPLLNLDKGETDQLPPGYYILRERLLNRLVHIEFMNQSLSPEKALNTLMECMSIGKGPDDLCHQEAVREKILSIAHTIKKEDLLIRLGLDKLKEKYQKDEFIKKLIRKKYLYEALED